ncbi:MAG: peptidylprolyl isomerase [Chloroflexi bacterium]|nr:peptidylprolyl isomerase [Chloroflexota bacterium]
MSKKALKGSLWSRGRLSRWEQEKRRQRLVLVLVASALVLVAGLVGFGYYDSYVAPTLQPVLRVDGNVVSMGYYLKRVLLYQNFVLRTGQTADIATAPFLLLSALQEEALVVEAASTLGLSVTPQEVSQAIQTRFSSPSPEPLVAEANYRQFLKDSGLNDDEYRKILTAEMLREKVKERLAASVPTTTEQVYVMALLLSDEPKAKETATKLKESADPAALAREASSDAEIRDKGGDLGWLPRGIRSPQFDEAAFGLPLGSWSQPISTTEGYYLLRVLERDMNREVITDTRQRLIDTAYRRWLDVERPKHRVEQYMDSSRYQWVSQQLERRAKRG